jgi:hypothetical protein
MSDLPPKADISARELNVRYGPKAISFTLLSADANPP